MEQTKKCSASSKFLSHSKRLGKIIIVPRPTPPHSSKSKNTGMNLEAFNTLPSMRKQWHVDSILSVMTKWPSFTKLAQNDEEYRSLCKMMNFHLIKANSIVYRAGDEYEGIFIVYSGRIQIFKENDQISQDNEKMKNHENTNNSYDSDSLMSQNFTDESKNEQNENQKIVKTNQNNEAFRSFLSFSKMRMSQTHQSPENTKDLTIKNDWEISLDTLYTLKNQFGIEKEFTLVDVKNPQDEFGFDNIDKCRPYENTALAVEDTYLIIISKEVYKMTLGFIREKDMQKKVDFLKNIKELSPISDQKEFYLNLAEKMYSKKLEKGKIFTKLCKGWIFIQSGCLVKRKRIDFNNHTIYNDDQNNSINVEIPNGETLIQTEEFHENHLIPDPSLSKEYKNEHYSLKAVDDTLLYIIDIDDIQNILPFEFRREIEKIIYKGNSDDELVKKWLEIEKSIRWKIFKDDCVKGAKLYAKQEQFDQNGGFPYRKPCPPKPLKDFKTHKISPRMRAYRSLRSD
ncbi:hypothetical protein TRFO_17719 [Tritrichomonas foetus]|uniref:Cyclic nucleotide-binding domain-containing protein n=1 Tax=Tritrichomonas foetus TaxID=1144522 RepID=A0A1J4KRK4_9EUKA|nr:hypothetical protein TRFO_17719 [Tritrichomonas foetus]|eukprot:OHT12444.1 hypothetical protein TRFO_17719 [Tritrichomonas foetus]